MRFYPSFFERVESKRFIGDDRPIGRVTVEPLWKLNETASSYGSKNRGPYRWFQDVADSGVEWEVPNIKLIEWDRSDTEDIASCTITLYNKWHESNFYAAEIPGFLGKPGYFWPKRGLDDNPWGMGEAKGAFRKDGFWDPNFSWRNVLERYALIRTYEGFGGHPTLEEFKSIQDNLDDENVLLTGTWLVVSISANTEGQMVLNCQDMGKLLQDQICFPPTVPSPIYPLEYYPAGKSAFDSVFGPKPKTGVSPGSQGEVRTSYKTSSLDVLTSTADAEVDGHKGSHSNDGNWRTYSLSEAYSETIYGRVWWEFIPSAPISKVSVKAWAGGYKCYLSIFKNGDWLGTSEVPDFGGLTYVKEINIPMSLPDNQEPVIHIEIPSEFYDTGDAIAAEYFRITFQNLYQSSIPDDNDYLYRGGIRDLIAYRNGNKVDPYTPDFETLPWTFAMAAHPTRGYWVIDSDGTVHGFGDAADYDSTAFGQVPLSDAVDASLNPIPDNKAISIAGTPDGKGYWVLDRVGHVYAYGTATHHGEYVVDWPGSDFWGEDNIAAWDIAPTYTGNGYWVCYGGGQLKGFGDATPNDEIIPWTSVGIFMNTYVDDKYLIRHQANSVTSHPHKMGCWVTTGSGEVFAFGEAQHFGQLKERVYNPGMADSFRLLKTEATRCIQSTKTGNGYWIAFGSGHIAAFGDAIKQGPTYVYPHDESLDVPIDETNIQDWSFFRAIVWDLAPDPDGTGFWVLVADGHVGSYNAEFWGNPGYTGLTGYRWHEGNFNGEYSDIVSEVLLWSGFTFYDPDLGSDELPQVLGTIESTGIQTDTFITADKFDKRPILDIIKELSEVVAYDFHIKEDGGVFFASKNIWRSGNFDEDGTRIYVDSGTFNRVEPDDEGAVEFIPVINETTNLMNYSVTLDSEAMRSEIIIGTDVPDPKNPSITGFVRHTPRSGSEQVAPGIPMLRGIPRVGMWVSQLFTNKEEAELMAELIAINAWFSERTASATTVGNPTLQVGDQVKFLERNTSETYIHYLSGIKSTNDLDTGVWTYDLTSHWLGTEDKWVILANGSGGISGSPDDNHYIEVSERVYRWANLTGRDIQTGFVNKQNEPFEQVFGSFDSSVVDAGGALWKLSGGFEVNDSHAPSIMLDTMTSPLGDIAWFKIYEDGDLIVNQALGPVGTRTVLPVIGTPGQNKEFTYEVIGYSDTVGNGVLKFRIENNSNPIVVTDTLIVME